MQESQVGGTMLGPFQEMWARIVDYVPSLIAGLLIVGLGLAVSWLVKKAVARLAILMRLDRALAGMRWARAMAQADVRHAVAGALGRLLAGVVFLIFLDNALVIWRLDVLAQLIGSLVFYLPRLLVGILVLIVGSILASAAATRVRAALASEGFARAGLAGLLTHWALMIVVAALTLEEMEIAPHTVGTALKIGMGSLGLALVLAVGLGSREAVARIWQSLLDTPNRAE